MSNLIPQSVRKLGVNGAVDSSIRRVTGANKFTQHAALFALETARDSGDWTPAARHIQGITKCTGTKSAKLKLYYETMLGGAEFVHDKEAYPEETGHWGFKLPEGFTFKDISLEMASAVFWYDCKAPEKDNTKELSAIAKSAINAATKSVETGKVSEDEVRQIEEFFARLGEIREIEALEGHLQAVA